MEPIAKFFLIFFLGSSAMLLLILLAAMPGIFRAVKRTFRHQMARRSRGARMLADPDKLRADSLALEGVYRFSERQEENDSRAA